MPYFDNPAGRLHELLTNLKAQNGQQSLVSAWAAVLAVPESDVVLHIGDVADLVRQIQIAADEIGERFLQAPVARYRDVWARPIYPIDTPPANPVRTVRPGEEAMEALESVSAHLHSLRSEGVVPDSVELDKLTEQVRALIDSIREADDLPPEIKQVIIDRLFDVEKAIQYVHIGGPDAVQRATEAVYGVAMRTATPATARSTSMRSIVVTLSAIFAVFTAGEPIQKGLEAWPNVLHTLTTGEVVEADDGGGELADEKVPAATDDKQTPARDARK